MKEGRVVLELGLPEAFLFLSVLRRGWGSLNLRYTPTSVRFQLFSEERAGRASVFLAWRARDPPRPLDKPLVRGGWMVAEGLANDDHDELSDVRRPDTVVVPPQQRRCVDLPRPARSRTSRARGPGPPVTIAW